MRYDKQDIWGSSGETFPFARRVDNQMSVSEDSVGSDRDGYSRPKYGDRGHEDVGRVERIGFRRRTHSRRTVKETMELFT